jgi:hypothetical protein
MVCRIVTSGIVDPIGRVVQTFNPSIVQLGKFGNPVKTRSSGKIDTKLTALLSDTQTMETWAMADVVMFRKAIMTNLPWMGGNEYDATGLHPNRSQ